MRRLRPSDFLLDVLNNLDKVISIVRDVLNITHFEVVWVKVQNLGEGVVLASGAL